MSTSTILVIDDSATIRKMVDSHLSQEGYRVVLAQNGEIGVEMAREIKPDLILLDHQLPGTTGLEVCRKIIQFPECRHIPFVVSSTLRKQAYIEYMDVPNVVDSLPKPFTPNLLKMAVANALETGAMIIASQTNGTAVPEVVGETDPPALSGDFRWLGLREVIDFLNNGRKAGMLEVETDRNRICFFLKDGRIQGVVSPSFDPAQIAVQLPQNLSELSPLLQFTLSSGTSTRVDGLVELMDKKVLDPRMLRTLLRHQAAALTRYCFTSKPTCFSFHPERAQPSLFSKVSIDTSLAGILVDGTLNCPPIQDTTVGVQVGWIRNGLRGQNLDRAGLSATHVQLLSHLDATPRNTSELAVKSGMPVDEARAVLEGFLLAEWVKSETLTLTQTRTLIAYEPDAVHGALIRNVIDQNGNGWTGNVVRDEFSLQLLLKRKTPDAVLIALQGESELALPKILQNSGVLDGKHTVVLIAPAAATSPPLAAELRSQIVIRRPYTNADILKAIDVPARRPVSPQPVVRPLPAGNNAATLCTTGAN
ncbi:MAG: response regulator [Fuerstia sp.]|nr:response regulator [Fuerstiella sp.]